MSLPSPVSRRSAFCWLFALLALCGVGSAGAQEEWEAPLPPGIKEAPVAGCPEDYVSQPVAAYRVSSSCHITGVEPVGGYRYGFHTLADRVRGFEHADVIRRFEGGAYQYRREIRIELHRAEEETAELTCHTDMLERQVQDAVIVRPPEREGGAPVREEIDPGDLPGLGVFTYTEDVPLPAECEGNTAP